MKLTAHTITVSILVCVACNEGTAAPVDLSFFGLSTQSQSTDLKVSPRALAHCAKTDMIAAACRLPTREDFLNAIVIWDADAGTLMKAIALENELTLPTAIAFSSDGLTISIAFFNGAIQVYDVRTSERIAVDLAPPRATICVAADGTVVVGCPAGPFEVLAARTLRTIARANINGGDEIAVDAKRRLLALAHIDQDRGSTTIEIRRWAKTPSPEVALIRTIHMAGPCTAIAFLSHGRLLGVAMFDQLVLLHADTGDVVDSQRIESDRTIDGLASCEESPDVLAAFGGDSVFAFLCHENDGIQKRLEVPCSPLRSKCAIIDSRRSKIWAGFYNERLSGERIAKISLNPDKFEIRRHLLSPAERVRLRYDVLESRFLTHLAFLIVRLQRRRN